MSRINNPSQTQSLAWLGTSFRRYRDLCLEIKTRTTLSVPLKDDKTYTFDTIARLFNEQFNISAAGDPDATLSYKDGKVNLYVKEETQLFNLKISEDIAKVLKIKGNTSNIGDVNNVNKIAFINTKNVFLVCDQINSTVIHQPLSKL